MKTKQLIMSMAILGIFLGFGFASASTADLVQPAQGPTYDGLAINGTASFDSVKVGKQGVGGVTFFNGTIVNETTDNGVPIPVTFGDDVRIDGEIWRSEKGGSHPLKISDHVVPTLSLYNNLGDDTHIWKGLYAKNGYFNEDIYSWGGLVTVARSEGTISAGQSEKVVIKDGKPFQLLIGHNEPKEYGVANITIMEKDWNMSGTGTWFDAHTGTPIHTVGGECCEYTSNYMLTMTDFADIQCPNEQTGDHNIIIHAKSAGDIYYRIIY